MFVYICCAGGATSSLLCENIKKSAIGKLKVHLDPISLVVSDLKSGKLDDYDIILGYGAASSITYNFVNEYNLNELLDLVLIAPQVRFEVGNIQKVMNPYNIPAELIDMKTFGYMNGDKILDKILSYKR